LRPHIIAVALAVFFFLSAHFFLQAYQRYTGNQEQLSATTRQTQRLTDYQRELARKQSTLKRIHGFVDRARSAGVERDRWAYYDVNIEASVPFQDAEQILGQTANSSSYYFKPIMLHVRANKEPDAKALPKKASAASGDSPDTKTGDVWLTLKGSFVVDRK
jgi:hypothetical protein